MKINEELLFSAKLNFENLERALPQIKGHPYYLLSKKQLDAGLGYKNEFSPEEQEPKECPRCHVDYALSNGNTVCRGCDNPMPGVKEPGDEWRVTLREDAENP